MRKVLLFAGMLAASMAAGAATAYSVARATEKGEAYAAPSTEFASNVGTHFTSYEPGSYPDLTYAAAGKAAHLAGAMAANTTLPVIGIPIKSSTLDGLDALLSTVQMPGGLPVATVAIDGAENAALLAIQILAVEDATLAEKLDNARKEAAEKVLAKNKALEEKYAK